MEPQAIAFMSYAHADDRQKRVSRFRERLSEEVEVQTGKEFPIFQDRIDIQWGEDWKDRIKKSLNESVFLIPILTPSFFNSSACREEVELFLQREKALKRNDLILPVYFVDCDVLNDKAQLNSDGLAQEINKHQRVDWREFRLLSYEETEVNRAITRLALEIKKALQRTKVVADSPNAATAGKFDSPANRLPPDVEELIANLVSRALQDQTTRSKHSQTQNGKRTSKATRRKSPIKDKKQEKTTTRRNYHYEKSVFISTPFDSFYEPLFEAVVFTVTDAGFVPRTIFEEGSRGSRIETILQLIEQCRYGIIDISRTELTNGLPRFNTPLELGLFLGSLKYGGGHHKKKSLLVLDRDQYRYRIFISDLSSWDISAHANSPPKMIQIVRDWLRGSTKAVIPSATEIYRRYKVFKKALPSICRKVGVKVDNLAYEDYTSILSVWLHEYGTANQR